MNKQEHKPRLGKHKSKLGEHKNANGEKKKLNTKEERRIEYSKDFIFQPFS